MMNCDACKKSFSGHVCYAQHLKSEKHLRKVKNLEMLKNQNGFSNASNNESFLEQNFCCPACNESFNVFSDYQKHTLSPLHASNVQSYQHKEQILSSCAVSSSDTNAAEVHVTNSFTSENVNVTQTPQSFLITESISNSCDINSSSTGAKNDYIIENLNLSTPEKINVSNGLSFRDCKVCNKHFSGPESYRQHMESSGHKKKVELEKAILENKSISFECNTCKKTFSGNIPYNQHMSSENHKRKLESLNVLQQQLNAIKQFDSVSVCDSANNGVKSKILDIANTNNPWYCKYCNIQCSGHIPYNQHVSGTSHKKNLIRAQMSNELENIKKHQVFKLEDTQDQPTAFESAAQINEITTSNNIQLNQKKETDKVLPEMIENLEVLTVEELNLKQFLPDSKIEFGKSEDEALNINEEEMKEISNENGVKDVYDECEFCNIQLFNKDEALSHYKSVEHIKKSSEYLQK